MTDAVNDGAGVTAQPSETLGEVARIVDHLADGVVVVDRAGRIRFANTAALGMFGRPADEVIGSEFGYPLVAGSAAEIEVVAKGGRLVNAELRVAATEWDGSDVLLVSLRDITDRKVAERHAQALGAERAARREAEAANRAKSQFLAMMSHELRTPLNAVLGYSELLELGMGGPLTDTQRQQVSRIAASGKHLLGLVDEVLDIAKVEAGKLELHANACEAHLVAAEAVMLVRRKAEEAGIVLDAPTAAAEDDRVYYWGDPDRVRQILVNLLTNAIKFTPSGGHVSVSVLPEHECPPTARVHGSGPWVTFVVADTGLGIPPEKLDEIFTPFVQVQEGRTRNHDGSGLGLTIARRLARLMDGDVTVRSEVNAGSTFTLVVPQARSIDTRATAGVKPVTDATRASASVQGLGEAGETLLRSLLELIDQVGRRVRKECEGAASLRYSQLTDHLPALLADIATVLIVLEEAAGTPSPILTDSNEFVRLLADRHGVQRAQLGWPQAALADEYRIVREEVTALLRQRFTGHERQRAKRAVDVLASILSHAETTSAAAFVRVQAPAPPENQEEESQSARRGTRTPTE